MSKIKKDTSFEQEHEMARQQVLRDELKARYQKAQFETAYYALEFDKLVPAYKELIDRQKQEQEDFFQKLKENIDKTPELNIEDEHKN